MTPKPQNIFPFWTLIILLVLFIFSFVLGFSLGKDTKEECFIVYESYSRFTRVGVTITYKEGVSRDYYPDFHGKVIYCKVKE